MPGRRPTRLGMVTGAGCASPKATIRAKCTRRRERGLKRVRAPAKITRKRPTPTSPQNGVEARRTGKGPDIPKAKTGGSI